MSTIEEAVATLDLPDADAVAALLREHGIRGLRISSRSCPLAKYLKNVTEIDLVVGAYDVVYFPDGGRGISLVLPDAALAFRRAFDDGRYQDLQAGVLDSRPRA